MPATEQLSLLFVDDSPDDIQLLRLALEDVAYPHLFRYALSAEEAACYLEGIGTFADRTRYPYPDMLFIDIKMPGMGGFGLLRWLQAHPQCKVTPTLILSSSSMDSDVEEAYALGVHAYLVKPISLNELVTLLEAACRFWSRSVLPPSLKQHAKQGRLPQ